MSNSWTCFLDLPPVAKARPRVTKSGFAYTPEKTRSSEAAIRYFLLMNEAPMFSGPVEVSISFHFLRPKSAKKRVWHDVRPDVDNLVKQVCDSAQGILFKNDGQIVRLSAEKSYGDRQGISISIASLSSCEKKG